jgi:hypothetical protein
MKLMKILILLKVALMFELLAAIGIFGLLMLAIGFATIFWLAKLIDGINNSEGNDDE